MINKGRAKQFLLIGICLYPLIVLGQLDKICSVIRTETEKIKTNFPEAKIINEISTFVINGKTELIDSFKKYVPTSILRKAVSNRNSSNKLNLLECYNSDELVRIAFADSTRFNSKKVLIDSILEDSIKQEINFIFNNYNGAVRDSLYRKITTSDQFKKIQAEKESQETHFILLSYPLLVKNKYLIFQISIISSDRHYDNNNLLYVCNKEGVWRFVHKYSW